MFWFKSNKNVENKVVEEPNYIFSNAQLEVELENLISKRDELIRKPYFDALIYTDSKIKYRNGAIDFNKIASCIGHDEIITSLKDNTTEKRWYFNNISYSICKDHNQYVAIKYYAKINKYFIEVRVETDVEHNETDGILYDKPKYSTFKSKGYDNLDSLKQEVANFKEIVDTDIKIHNIRKAIANNNHKQKCAELEAQAWE